MRGEKLKTHSTRDKETSGLKQYIIYCVLNFFGWSLVILGLQIFTVKLKNNAIRTKILDKPSKV